ncbi:MAG: DUF4870 domain-containing protein [Gammaproteobacteria bacterium]|jgi:uncharacterized Tic20 family protein|nr:DUF4870 domain-containing protein [Gammaproteobacteria bacterium]
MNEPHHEPAYGEDDKETNNWAMIMHLSMLAGLIVPIAGLIVPIVIYVLKKDSLPGLQPHGYVVFNWMISAFIYAIIGTILILAFGLGILVLMALGVLSLLFPIIGGIKASEGEVWPYPLSINFFK